MPDRVFIPLPGIGTLSLTRAEYESALIPIRPEVPKPEAVPTSQLPRQVDPRATPAAIAQTGARGLRYIRLREVCQRVGLKHSSVYRLIALGRFPKQVKLSERTAAWIESEVEGYMDARIVERDQQPAPSVPPSSPYIRMGEVMKRTGLNSATIYELVRKGAFPKWADLPKIASGWLKTDIDAWLQSHEQGHLLR
jgi:prophage regulatory protein